MFYMDGSLIYEIGILMISIPRQVSKGTDDFYKSI